MQQHPEQSPGPRPPQLWQGQVRIDLKRARAIVIAALALAALLGGALLAAHAAAGTLSGPLLYGAAALLALCVAGVGWGFYALGSLIRRLGREMAEKTLVDELTGVANYRYLERRLAEEDERRRRYGGKASVLFLDLDNFNQVNERYGHACGNAVLREVARALQRQVRSADLLGRVGGDEFLVLMPESGRRDALTLGRRLCGVVQNYRYQPPSERAVDFLDLTVGIGVCPENGDSVSAAVEAADRALLKGKRSGKPGCYVSEETIPPEEVPGRLPGTRIGPAPDREETHP